jgi:exopolysaccharide biosynthesis polyprenyl glycosylphosphotransferase
VLREQAKLFNRLTIVVDSAVILAAFVLAYAVRNHFDPPLFPLREYAWTLFIILPAWLYLLARHRLFASIRRLTLFDILSRLMTAHVWGAFVVAAVLFFVDRDLFSRSLFLLFIAFSFFLLAAEKCSLRLALGYLRRRGYNYRQILIVGGREKACGFHHLLKDHADLGLRVVGCVQVNGSKADPCLEGNRVLGHVTNLVEICKKHPVDEVVFCLQKDFVVDAESYVQDLEELGITVRVVLDFYQMDQSRREVSFFHGGIPILTYHTKSLDAQQLLAKRALDVVGALVGLLVTGLLLPFIALAIKLDSPGPVFFPQKRVGEGGRIFCCWKFRTMGAGAERRKRRLLDRNEMSGAIFKIRNDPRVTRVGKFLRRTSLDELPQFWNVLKGEMSLVGTRPPTRSEVRQYQNWHRRRISIKPGITGMWQVSGRNAIEDFDEIVRLDLYYIDNWSLWLDLKLLLKTVKVVLAQRGSC